MHFRLSDYRTVSQLIIWYRIPALPPKLLFFLLQPWFLRDGACTKGLLLVKKSTGAANIELGISMDDITATCGERSHLDKEWGLGNPIERDSF